MIARREILILPIENFFLPMVIFPHTSFFLENKTSSTKKINIKTKVKREKKARDSKNKLL
jgi:hypothetical protein